MSGFAKPGKDAAAMARYLGGAHREVACEARMEALALTGSPSLPEVRWDVDGEMEDYRLYGYWNEGRTRVRVQFMSIRDSEYERNQKP